MWDFSNEQTPRRQLVSLASDRQRVFSRAKCTYHDYFMNMYATVSETYMKLPNIHISRHIYDVLLNHLINSLSFARVRHMWANKREWVRDVLLIILGICCHSLQA